jgi:hypothetical protein
MNLYIRRIPNIKKIVLFIIIIDIRKIRFYLIK